MAAGNGGAELRHQPAVGVPHGHPAADQDLGDLGCPLAFITSLDDVVISPFIAGGDTATLTRRMFNALRDEIDPTIAAISTLLILMSVVLLGLTQLLQRSPSSAPATDRAAGKR